MKHIALTLLLPIMLAALGTGQEGVDDPVPFKLVNPQAKFFPKQQALRIYGLCVYNTAREINPARPPTLALNLTIRFDPSSANPTIRYFEGETTLTWREWNAGTFSYASCYAAFYSLIAPGKIRELATFSLREAAATVAVDELRKPN